MSVREWDETKPSACPKTNSFINEVASKCLSLVGISQFKITLVSMKNLFILHTVHRAIQKFFFFIKVCRDFHAAREFFKKSQRLFARHSLVHFFLRFIADMTIERILSCCSISISITRLQLKTQTLYNFRPS